MDKTPAQAQKALEQTRAHNEARLSSLHSEIAERIEVGCQHADLDAKLAEVKAQAEAAEHLSLATLKEAQERTTKQEAENAERLNARSAALDEQRKRAARLAWYAHGGNPSEFETAWETTIRADLLKAAVVADIVNRGSNRLIRSL